MSEEKKPPFTKEGQSRGGSSTQKILRERGEHPLSRYNFWAHATPAQKQQHRLARSARAKAERACVAILKYQKSENGTRAG